MGKIYKVTVTEVEDDVDRMIIELTAPVEMLRQFAPAAVAAALGEAEQPIVTPAPNGEPEPFNAKTHDEPVRRKRRTKAEMEAARAADAETAPRQVTGDQSAFTPEPIPPSETVTTADPAKAEPKPAYNPFA